MTLARPVTIPAAATAGGGILANAGPLPEGWERGLTFASTVCRVAGTHQFCADSPAEKQFAATDIAVFAPYGVETGVECTTLTPNNEVLDQAGAALSVIAEFNIGVELATGATSGNPSLADATPLAASADVVAAVAALDASLAAGLRGYRGWVHMSPQTLVYAVALGAVWRDFTGWTTPGGHVVVASPGYADTLDDVVVATSEVFAGIGTADRISTVDRRANVKVALYEAPALAVFDPCYMASTEITGDGD